MDMSAIWQQQRRINTANGISQNGSQADDHMALSNFDVFNSNSVEASFWAYASAQPFTHWSHPNQPLERFMREDGPLVISASFPRQNSFQSTNMDGVSPLPQATHHRMISPAPSQEQSSYCSSTHSPGADNEIHQKQNSSPVCYSPQSLAHDVQSLGHNNGGSRSSLDVQPSEHGSFPYLQSNSSYYQPRSFPTYPRDNMNNQGGISLDQVQMIADHQDSQEANNEDGHFEFQSGENGYYSYKGSNAPAGGAYSMPDQMRNPYCHSSDEGIGPSLQDPQSTHQHTPSVQNESVDVDAASTIYPDPDNDADVDVDVEVDVEVDVDYEESSDDSDPEFQPTRSTRSRKPRRAATRNSKALGPNSQNSRIQKSTLSKKAAAQRRSKNENANPRPFTCIFAFAGCKADFPNKNEWKRHVTTQHVCLDIWICNQGACANNDQPNEFNRKDLFTQHLRRMHPPFDAKKGVSKKSAQSVVWEEKLKELQKECVQVKKNPPRKTICPVEGCGSIFEGNNRDAYKKAWDERMEHIGKHLDPTGGISKVHHQHDPFLIEWAQQEGIVERVSSGWRLAGTGAEEDIDADGEEED